MISGFNKPLIHNVVKLFIFCRFHGFKTSYIPVALHSRHMLLNFFSITFYVIHCYSPNTINLRNFVRSFNFFQTFDNFEFWMSPITTSFRFSDIFETRHNIKNTYSHTQTNLVSHWLN